MTPGPERVEFGRAVADYIRHRPGFTAALLDAARARGVGVARQRVLDLGTGTGSLARGLAGGGCRCVGLDVSASMLAAAQLLAEEQGVPVAWVRASADAPPFRDATFDAVVAGQCWHWFDGPRTAAEVRRVLRSGGRCLVATMDYDVAPGSLGAATEALILSHLPTWRFAGSQGGYPHYRPQLEEAGLRHVETFMFVEPIVFSHASWRGRIRACNALITMSEAAATACDAAIAAMLERDWPEPLAVDHVMLGIVAERPLEEHGP